MSYKMIKTSDGDTKVIELKPKDVNHVNDVNLFPLLKSRMRICNNLNKGKNIDNPDIIDANLTFLDISTLPDRCHVCGNRQFKGIGINGYWECINGHLNNPVEVQECLLKF
jgi:hypothetical protein